MINTAYQFQPEVRLRFMRYLNPDRSQVEQISPDVWIDRATALGERYQPGKVISITSFVKPEESGVYVVAEPPLESQVRYPDETGELVPLVTIYFTLFAPSRTS